MPRGVKGSGKAKEPTTKRPYHRKSATAVAPVEPVVNEQPTEAPVATQVPVRKPYPTVAERIALADKQIARLTALNASRTALVEKTSALLTERQEALAKSTAALTSVENKKAKLVAAASKPAKEKLTPEERKARMAAGREAKRLEREKVEALMAALKDSGKSVDELLAELAELKG